MASIRQHLVPLALAAGLAGCLPAPPSSMPGIPPISGRLDGSTRAIAATFSEVTIGATVSLIDPATGNTVASSLTDGTGAFVLTFNGFTPTSGAAYVLEAVKGLSSGGSPNRAGSAAARLRTFLFWNNGWQSFTNSTVNSGIVVGNATTALSAIVSLKEQAGASLTLANLIGKVNEGGDSFTETGTGLSNANDFLAALPLVSNAIALDQDPLAAIAYNRNTGAYSLETGVPWIGDYSPALPIPGGTLTVRGTNLDKLNGRNQFWFGATPASTWSVSPDRTTATVTIPANAYSAPFTLQQPSGVVQTIAPFLKLRGTVGTLVGTGTAGNGSGKIPFVDVDNPEGVAIDAAGNIFYTNYGTSACIKKLAPDGTVTTYAGTGTAGYADGPRLSAQFTHPYELVFDAQGNLYVTESDSHRIRKITPGGMVSTLAGNGTAGATDGTGTGANLNNPVTPCFDRSGNLLVSEYTAKKIRRISPTGVVTTLASTGGFVSNPASPLVLSSLSQPYGLAVDSQGNIFVGDDGSPYQVWKINPNTGAYTAFAGNGTSGYADNANGLQAQFNGCHDMRIDASDNLYLLDPHSTNLIRKISPTGSVTSIGSVRTTGFADGPFSSAQMGNMGSLCLAPDGSFLVADPANHRVRVVTP